MRLLLFAILSSLLFLAPLQGNAIDAGVKQLTKHTEKTSLEKGLGDYSANDDFDANISYFNHRNSSTQYRIYPFLNFLNTIAFPGKVEFSIEKKSFLPPYLYFKPIALKLVFPEHYFW